uniref:Uncharacterized protein n=1 Tax=Phlebotomus papatasi TaxID=29031 RepID=A0A1B0DBC5_PHLPP
MCGEETAAFTRKFLDKMADSLIREHCEDYSITSGRCSYETSTGTSSKFDIILALMTTIFTTYHWMDAR